VDIDTENTSTPPVLVEYIRLPDTITTGRFDTDGRSNAKGNLFITVRDTAFLWGVFCYKLNAGQRGEMVFTNVPGTFLVGVSFTEWDDENNEPYLGEALYTLISAQRGEDTVRIVGRYTSSVPLAAADGIVVADDASYLPHAHHEPPPK
jgi:hypothetical protein